MQAGLQHLVNIYPKQFGTKVKLITEQIFYLKMLKSFGK